MSNLLLARPSTNQFKPTTSLYKPTTNQSNPHESGSIQFSPTSFIVWSLFKRFTSRNEFGGTYLCLFDEKGYKTLYYARYRKMQTIL